MSLWVSSSFDSSPLLTGEKCVPVSGECLPHCTRVMRLAIALRLFVMQDGNKLCNTHISVVCFNTGSHCITDYVYNESNRLSGEERSDGGLY